MICVNSVWLAQKKTSIKMDHNHNVGTSYIMCTSSDILEWISVNVYQTYARQMDTWTVTLKETLSIRVSTKTIKKDSLYWKAEVIKFMNDFQFFQITWKDYKITTLVFVTKTSCHHSVLNVHLICEVGRNFVIVCAS